MVFRIVFYFLILDARETRRRLSNSIVMISVESNWSWWQAQYTIDLGMLSFKLYIHKCLG